MEKIVIAFRGTYLGKTGIEKVLVEHEIYSPGMFDSVMSESNYIRGNRGLVLSAEKLERLQIDAFASSSHCFEGCEIARRHDFITQSVSKS